VIVYGQLNREVSISSNIVNFHQDHRLRWIGWTIKSNQVKSISLCSLAWRQ